MWASPHFFQGHELDYLALKIGLSAGVKPAASEQTSAWEASYNSEILSLCSWGISSISPGGNIGPRTRLFTVTSSKCDTQEGDGTKVVEKLPKVPELLHSLTGFCIKDQAVDQY